MHYPKSRARHYYHHNNLFLCETPKPDLPEPESPRSDKTEAPAIRRVTLGDLPAIMSIERASFSNPWSLTCFRSELQDNDVAHYFCLVYNNEVVGYMGYWVVFDEAHITNVAVSPWCRGQGMGAYLMSGVMLYCIKTGIKRMTLEVRASNEIAQRMYGKLGFAAVGVRPRYYSDNREDAVVMWATL